MKCFRKGYPRMQDDRQQLVKLCIVTHFSSNLRTDTVSRSHARTPLRAGVGWNLRLEVHNVPLYMFRLVGPGFIYWIWNETCCALASHVRANFTECYLPHATRISAAPTCSHHVAFQGIVHYPINIQTVYCFTADPSSHGKWNHDWLIEVYWCVGQYSEHRPFVDLLTLLKFPNHGKECLRSNTPDLLMAWRL